MNAQVQEIRTTTETTTAHGLECTLSARLAQIKDTAYALQGDLHEEGSKSEGAAWAIETLAEQAEAALSGMCRLNTLKGDDGDIVISRRSDEYNDLQAAVGILRSIVRDDHDPDMMDEVTRATLEKVLQLLPGVKL